MIETLRAALAAAEKTSLTLTQQHVVARHLHTLKGEAQMLGFTALVAEAQAIETSGLADGTRLHAALTALGCHLEAACAELSAPAIKALAASVGKAVAVDVIGDLEALPPGLARPVRTALLHLVRNAIAHGIARHGRITLVVDASARELITVSCADDGCGVDPNALAVRAVERSFISASVARRMTRAERLTLAFLPGLSTDDEVSALSGAGIGLHAVHAVAVENGGSARIESEPGLGTRVTLSFPAVP